MSITETKFCSITSNEPKYGTDGEINLYTAENYFQFEM